MASRVDYNHIHDAHEKSYGHMRKKGGDAHMTHDHSRGSAPGYHQGDGQHDGRHPQSEMVD